MTFSCCPKSRLLSQKIDDEIGRLQTDEAVTVESSQSSSLIHMSVVDSGPGVRRSSVVVIEHVTYVNLSYNTPTYCCVRLCPTAGHNCTLGSTSLAFDTIVEEPVYRSESTIMSRVNQSQGTFNLSNWPVHYHFQSYHARLSYEYCSLCFPTMHHKYCSPQPRCQNIQRAVAN